MFKQVLRYCLDLLFLRFISFPWNVFVPRIVFECGNLATLSTTGIISVGCWVKPECELALITFSLVYVLYLIIERNFVNCILLNVNMVISLNDHMAQFSKHFLEIRVFSFAILSTLCGIFLEPNWLAKGFGWMWTLTCQIGLPMLWRILKIIKFEMYMIFFVYQIDFIKALKTSQQKVLKFFSEWDVMIRKNMPVHSCSAFQCGPSFNMISCLSCQMSWSPFLVKGVAGGSYCRQTKNVPWNA